MREQITGHPGAHEHHRGVLQVADALDPPRARGVQRRLSGHGGGCGLQAQHPGAQLLAACRGLLAETSRPLHVAAQHGSGRDHAAAAALSLDHPTGGQAAQRLADHAARDPELVLQLLLGRQLLPRGQGPIQDLLLQDAADLHMQGARVFAVDSCRRHLRVPVLRSWNLRPPADAHGVAMYPRCQIQPTSGAHSLQAGA